MCLKSARVIASPQTLLNPRAQFIIDFGELNHRTVLMMTGKNMISCNRRFVNLASNQSQELILLKNPRFFAIGRALKTLFSRGVHRQALKSSKTSRLSLLGGFCYLEGERV
jgi:hypothetical protein